MGVRWNDLPHTHGGRRVVSADHASRRRGSAAAAPAQGAGGDVVSQSHRVPRPLKALRARGIGRLLRRSSTPRPVVLSPLAGALEALRSLPPPVL